MAFAALLAAGFGAWSTYQSGRIAQAESRSQANIALHNAQVAEQDAKAAEEKTRYDQIRQQRIAQAMLGTMRAKAGASGVEIDTGAPLKALGAQAGELALENMLIGVEGRTQASRFESEANVQRSQAKIYRQRAKNAGAAGIIGAATTLLTGFAQGREEGMW